MTSDPTVCSLTDLHTHILPCVDDGADSIETAIAMLTAQKNSGVERVTLTPHFYPMREELDSFLDRRQKAYDALLAYWDCSAMPQLQLAAEVRYSPALLQMELRNLTIGAGNYLLLEFPDFGVITYAEQVVKQLIEQEIIPVLAHVERCCAFRNNPNLLLELIQMGALSQIDMDALSAPKPDKFAIKCLKNGLAHIIASDTHNMSSRAHCIADLAGGRFAEMLTRSEIFARAIWDDSQIPHFSVKPLRKFLLGYR